MTETHYVSGFIHEGSPNNAQLQFFSQPEGYVKLDNGQYSYVYNYKDHLENVRLSYTDANQNNTDIVDLDIVEENNYYPFGLEHNGYNGFVSTEGDDAAQRWKFAGKEYQEDMDLNWYDITARNYDPAIGRWMKIDPLAEMMRRHSPYNYAFDNPVYFIDSDGMAPNESEATDGYGTVSETSSSYSSTTYRVEDEHGNVVTMTSDELTEYVTANGVMDDFSFSADHTDPKKKKKSKKKNSSDPILALLGASSYEALLAEAAGGTTTMMSLPAAGAAILSGLLVSSDTRPKSDEEKKADEERQRTWVTYLKYGSNGEVYAGRASGNGTPEEVMRNRDARHVMPGFGVAVLDQSAQGMDGRTAIRGREQQLIDAFGGAKSDPNRLPVATSANKIRGVSKYNPLGSTYHASSNYRFGNIAPFTGKF